MSWKTSVEESIVDNLQVDVEAESLLEEGN